MNGRFGAVLAGCLLAMVFGSSAARAADGRIAFSGAISSPTCSASDINIDTLMSQHPMHDVSSSQLSCPAQSAAVARDVTTYSLNVANLDVVTASGDQLLAYFVNYLNSAGYGAAQAKLVTQSFT